MNWCMADIHGCADAYRTMMERLNLRYEDTLYILGDVVDRGPGGIEILRDMMGRPNVYPILGNHEYMATYCLKLLQEDITPELISRLEREDGIKPLQDWIYNGGSPTIDSFQKLDRPERNDLLDYLEDFAPYETVRAGEREFLLVHAGLENFSPDRPLRDYGLHELIFHAPDYNRVYFPDVYLVTGHLPTRAIPGNPNPDRIWQGNHHIAIDCGCVFGGHLGAICLETGEEVYV